MQRCGRKTRRGKPCQVPLRGGKCITHDSDLAKRNKAVRASFAANDPARYAELQGRAMRGRTGEAHPRFKPNATNPFTLRHRAQRLFPDPQACARCGAAGTPEQPLHRHHKDENPAHNEPDNIEILCPDCHVAVHNGTYHWLAQALQPAAPLAAADLDLVGF